MPKVAHHVLVVSVMALLGGACRHATSTVRRTPLEEARDKLRRGDAEGAIDLLTRLRRERPLDLDVCRAFVEAQVRALRAEPLVGELTQELARLPEGTPARVEATLRYTLGLLHFGRATHAGDPALAELGKAAALVPDEPEFQLRFGIALLESERYPDAVAALRRAVDRAPNRADVRLPLALALAKTGKKTEAVDELRAMLDLRPDEAQVEKGRALMEQIANPFAAVPKSARPKLDEAVQWLETVDIPQQAIVALEDVLRDFPDLAVVHALLGMAYQRLDDAGRAVEEYKRAIELDQTDGRNHLYLAELYVARKRPEPAKESFKRAAALHPFLEKPYLELGELALSGNDFDAAIAQFQRLVLLRPKAAGYRERLATALHLSGDYTGADRELRAALEQAPGTVEYMLRLGMVHADKHARARTQTERNAAAAEARRWLGEVLQAQPENAVASQLIQSLGAK